MLVLDEVAARLAQGLHRVLHRRSVISLLLFLFGASPASFLILKLLRSLFLLISILFFNIIKLER